MSQWPAYFLALSLFTMCLASYKSLHDETIASRHKALTTHLLAIYLIMIGMFYKMMDW